MRAIVNELDCIELVPESEEEKQNLVDVMSRLSNDYEVGLLKNGAVIIEPAYREDHYDIPGDDN